MNEEIRELEPKILWNKFADLNEVPRPSKKEERVIEFMKNFGNKLNLETLVDETGNVVIKKPATSGMEDRKPIVLQAHLDMVHQKNNDTDFDFETSGINMYVDGDWVRAKGTTLGADNGLGVASMMAILESNDIEHPALEALFTIDEETGMTGAKGLDSNLLEGDILLNLDTEEDDEIGIGCAGGVDITAVRDYEVEHTPDNSVGYQIKVKGLQGGHSGMDIIKGLANANKIMARVLFDSNRDFGLRVSSILGGGLRNAIPRESEAIVVVDKSNTETFLTEIIQQVRDIKAEFASLEPNMDIEISETEVPNEVMKVEDQQEVVKAISAAHNGVYRMSPDIKGLVEASNNIASVKVGEGKVKINCLTRSSVESSKDDLANSLEATFELAKFKVKLSGEYPGWAPNPKSDILKVVDELYQKLHNEKADVAACHAGLECGIIGNHYPEMDMISFGPTIRGAHSPDERASITSAQKYWKFLREVLKNIPKK
ncbi:aminoacyl-histidine dipeptidase [Salegentibacter salinarum]|uniref:Cytosol non-specific dipeptidase n=1 Tax=Salegentibacter salinarum TaxID=447422 RepID=A0A2N0TZK8_9FLAO|nr:aminoacyl-histidine dipeptidase [Salegentibacter salinarum]PKD20177.1 aminoacyl-histidine dipeptidase [Salegentibacter salinarum]SKB86639.1 dipeptidase D [Salegentibacter salinarum]